jgi:hypothetical protein
MLKNPWFWLATLVAVIGLSFAGYWVGRQIRVVTTSSSSSSVSSSVTSSTSSTIAVGEPNPSAYTVTIVLPRENNGVISFETVKRQLSVSPGVKDVLTLIQTGPVGQSELAQGVYAPFQLTGASNCGGPDYVVSGDTSTADIKLCRAIAEGMPASDTGVAGSGLRASGRALQSMVESLKLLGFTTVNIRDLNNNCYAADSGVVQGCVAL